MAVDAFGNWDGVCACGKKELDGIQCRFGATHLPHFRDRAPMPWSANTDTSVHEIKEANAPSAFEMQIKNIEMPTRKDADTPTENATGWTPPWAVKWRDVGGAIIYPIDATYLRKSFPWE